MDKMRTLELTVSCFLFSLILNSVHALGDNGRGDFIISRKAGTQDVLESFSTNSFSTREDLLWSLHESLLTNTETSQAPVQAYLSSINDPQMEFQSLWLQNKIILKNAPLTIASEILQTFHQIVSSVEQDSFVYFEYPHQPVPFKPQTQLNLEPT